MNFSRNRHYFSPNRHRFTFRWCLFSTISIILIGIVLVVIMKKMEEHPSVLVDKITTIRLNEQKTTEKLLLTFINEITGECLVLIINFIETLVIY